MTLITVVCYDFVIFSRSKLHTFEKSTFYRAVIFWKFRREKINLFFCSALFTFVLKPRRKNNLYDFCGNERSFVGKTRLPRILTETL